MEVVIQKLRQQLFDGGIRGINKVRDVFYQVDGSGTGFLSRDDFVESLNYGGLFLTKAEVSCVVKAFGTDVQYEDFLSALVGSLSPSRSSLVSKAWGVLDNGSGECSLSDIESRYNSAKHPQVLSGTLSADEATSRLGSAFSDYVTQSQFFLYCTELSACIPSDDYFTMVFENCWGIDAGLDAGTSADPMFLFLRDLREKVRQKTHGSNEREKLRQAFKFFDADECGFIQPVDFGRALERFGIRLPLLEQFNGQAVDRAAEGSKVAPGGGAGVDIGSLLSDCDTEGDGSMNYTVFLRMLFGDEYAE
jgi:Ca2+-binding EF-hand superfamily protein